MLKYFYEEQTFGIESQGVLADYNLLVDKLNTDTERVEVEQEAAELRAQNEADAKEASHSSVLNQERLKMYLYKNRLRRCSLRSNPVSR